MPIYINGGNVKGKCIETLLNSIKISYTWFLKIDSTVYRLELIKKIN